MLFDDPQVPLIEVQNVLQSVAQSKRLSTVVKIMAREIARLHADNTQLHAAVAMYREAARRHTLRATRQMRLAERAE